MAHRWSAPALVLLGVILLTGMPRAQTPSGSSNAAAGKLADDHELFKKLLTQRSEYQKALEQLHSYYLRSGDKEKERWAREELVGFHRIPKHAFILALVVPPPNLQGHDHVPDANNLITWGLQYKDRGFGTDYIDNQRRAELIFQEILTKYPHCDKISDVAFFLGEVYESAAYRQYDLAAEYYQRCFQWNPKTNHEARLRAARIFDRQLKVRNKAIELYREVEARDLDPRRKEEAKKRIAELTAVR